MKNKTIGISIIVCSIFTLILNFLMIIGIIGDSTPTALILGMVSSACILYLGFNILKKNEE